MQMRDTEGDVFLSTSHVVDFVCGGDVAAFIGPEHTCREEATIAAAKDLPMISYVSLMSSHLFDHILLEIFFCLSYLLLPAFPGLQ